MPRCTHLMHLKIYQKTRRPDAVMHSAPEPRRIKNVAIHLASAGTARRRCSAVSLHTRCVAHEHPVRSGLKVHGMKVTLKLPNLSEVRPKNMRTREEVRASLIQHYASPFRSRSNRGITHMLDLDDKYPECNIFGPQCISAEVGPGWKELVEGCLLVLSATGCTAGQIKQKFGGLRFYWNYPDHIEEALVEWRKTPGHTKIENGQITRVIPMPFDEECDRINTIVRPVIAAAEAQSYLTCEDCGVTLEKGGACTRTQCAACKALDQPEGRRRGV